MSRHQGLSFWLSCGAISAALACSTAQADLLGYWSANSPNDDFAIENDQGNADLAGELFGEAAYTADQGGRTGSAGDYGLEFGGVIEDYAALPHSEEVTFEEITLTTWMKGEHTGDWSGIFYSRGATALGLGYAGGSGNLTYTWNDNVSDTWNFGTDKPELNIPQNEWTFVALTIEPDNATLYVGAQGGTLESATNEIPHIPQLAVTEWRLGQDNCCGEQRNFIGTMDDAAIWDHRLTADQIAELHSGAKLPNDPSFAERLGGLRQVQIAGGEIGIESLGGALSDIVIGAPIETSGLAQFWYEGNMRGMVDGFLAAGDEGSAANPLVTSGPFASSTTWWAGSQNPNIVSGMELARYPAGLAGTRFEGSDNADNYGVRLTGEVFIAANGDYLLRDGIDDFTMIAIDQDGNGELDELANITDGDVGTLVFPGDPFGDVLVLDDDWATIDGGSQAEEFHGIAAMENIAADGEWRKIEIWMSEGGGGDAGILYMANLDDVDAFDETAVDALSQEQIDKFVIRNDQLRSVVSVVESASAIAGLRTNVEYVLQVGESGNDQFSINDNNGVYTTTLDVTDATVRIEGTPAEGTTLTLFDADNVTGIDTLNLLLDDVTQWDLTNLSAGQITFGSAPNVGIDGDIDGDGSVGFADFLVLSANFGMSGAAAQGDVDGDGQIGFSDFLILSSNFGSSAGASVPEPSSLTLLVLSAMACGLLRRRR